MSCTPLLPPSHKSWIYTVVYMKLLEKVRTMQSRKRHLTWFLVINNIHTLPLYIALVPAVDCGSYIEPNVFLSWLETSHKCDFYEHQLADTVAKYSYCYETFINSSIKTFSNCFKHSEVNSPQLWQILRSFDGNCDSFLSINVVYFFNWGLCF